MIVLSLDLSEPFETTEAMQKGIDFKKIATMVRQITEIIENGIFKPKGGQKLININGVEFQMKCLGFLMC